MECNTSQADSTKEDGILSQEKNSSRASLCIRSNNVPKDLVNPTKTSELAVMPRVSIVLVTYNGLEIGVLHESIDSVMQSNFRDFELIIVDNGSNDGSVDFLRELVKEDPRVRVLFKGYNSGYSSANNDAAKHAQGEYLAFLHNDAKVKENWLEELLLVIEANERIGAVQPQIRDFRNPSIIISEGNVIDKLGFVSVERFGETASRRKPPHPILSATAACMLFRRHAFEIAGGFDEDYFLSYDEIDLCWRTWLRGYEIYCVPDAIIWHRASTTVDRFFRSKVSYFDSRNRLKSIMKNYGKSLLTMYFVPSILATVAVAVSKALRGDIGGATATVKGVWKALAGLAETLQWRHYVQTGRKIPDSYLLDRGLITRVAIPGLYRRSAKAS
jgi:hypothetical protein